MCAGGTFSAENPLRFRRSSQGLIVTCVLITSCAGTFMQASTEQVLLTSAPHDAPNVPTLDEALRSPTRVSQPRFRV